MKLYVTYEEFARLLGVSLATLDRWEAEDGTDEPTGFDLEVLLALDRAVQLDPWFGKRFEGLPRHCLPMVRNKLRELWLGTCRHESQNKGRTA